MTNQEILTKAIEKAIAGGFEELDEHGSFVNQNFYTEEYGEPIPEAFIFNHDFAKALWGNAEWRTHYSGTMGEGYTLMPTWQAHLQAMVIADDPIKYLGENI